MKESKKKKENGEAGAGDEDEEDSEDDDEIAVANQTKEVYYKKAPLGKTAQEMEPEEGEEFREAVPLVVAMKEMSKEERVSMSPGGDIDPLEVLESLPKEMRECFEKQNVGMLLELQKTMHSTVFNPILIKCIKAGLWS